MTDQASPARLAWSAVAAATELGPGTAVLDVGCGTGGFCSLAAAQGASVHGADADAGRIRAARRAVPGGDFRVARSEQLPWPDGQFDVVTGFNVFQYAGDVERALTEARRVTRAGGRVAVCKWGPPAENEFFAFLGRLDPARLSLSQPVVDPVERALERLAMEVVAAGEVPADIAMAGDDALAEAVAAASPATAALAADRDAWLTAIRDAGSPFRQPDGGYRFRNRLKHTVVAA